ncbi:hypothetical protein [Metabacillus litoralis]|nr:hypothetical protein [Metabacillus litoralis]
MYKTIALSILGVMMLMLGIYLSTHWIIIGTLMSIFGGFVMGGSSYFF